uniref:CUB domain-containing protein n=1 Tax=Magallana gigas TaxID=29159 RepID=A0A8W8M4G6_MAGGI
MNGNITYRPFDDGLQSWRHCDWLVILPKLSSVRLNFLDFDLPPADFGHCKQGFLILGTFDTKGNRESKLGPVCGTWLPKAILLPTDKFWLSVFRVPAEPGQSSTGYRGFTLSFTQVLHPAHGSEDSSSSLDPRWFAAIVIAGPLLCVIPLYICLRKRRSLPLYCDNPDTSEMVAQRFQKKHRPLFKPDLERSRNIQILETQINKSHFSKSPKSNFLTIPMMRTRKSRSSYLSILPDFESTLDHSKIQSMEQLNRKSAESLTLASIGKVDGKPVYVIQDQPPSNKQPTIPVITITSASLRRKQRLSTVKKPEYTNSDSALMDKKSGQQFRGSLRPCKHAKAWQSEDDSSDEIEVKEPDKESDKQESYNQTTDYWRPDQQAPDYKKPSETASGNMELNLNDPNDKAPICEQEPENNVPDKKNEPTNKETAFQRPDRREPYIVDPNRHQFSAPVCNTAKSCLDSHFEFSTPSIMLYKSKSLGRPLASSDDTCFQSESTSTHVYASLIGTPDQMEADFSKERDYQNNLDDKCHPIMTLEERVLLKQMTQPQVMGVDNLAYESSDDGKETEGLRLKPVKKGGELDYQSLVTDENMNCVGAGCSG